MATAPTPGRPDRMSIDVIVNGREWHLDINDLTLGDRRRCRIALKELGDTDEMDYFAAILWIKMRVEKPELTLEQVLDLITIRDLDDVEVDGTADLSDPEA